MIIRCVVNYARDAKDGDELTIRVGERLALDMSHNVNLDESNGWYYASRENPTTGKKESGLIPSNFVRVLSAKGEEEKKGQRKTSVLLCRVDFRRKAEEVDELEITPGDVLTMDMSHPVNEDESNGWYMAINSGGKEGLVPSNFVQIIDVEGSVISTNDRRPSTQRFHATMTRQAEADDELDVRAGDVLFVDMSHEVNREENGWYLAQTSDGGRGLVPNFCLRALSVRRQKRTSTVSSNEEENGGRAKDDAATLHSRHDSACRVFDKDAGERVPKSLDKFALDDLDLYDVLCEKGWVLTNVRGNAKRLREEDERARNSTSYTPPSIIRMRDTVEIDYAGYVWDGTSDKIDLFENTLSRRTPKWFLVNDESALMGLSLALRHMRVGQTADLIVAPHKAFGDKGNIRLGIGSKCYLVLKHLRVWRVVSKPALENGGGTASKPIDTARIPTHELQRTILPQPSGRSTEPKILQRLAQIIEESERAGDEDDDDNADATKTSVATTRGAGRKKRGSMAFRSPTKKTAEEQKRQSSAIHRVTYQHVRDSLVREFGRESFNLNKRLIQKALLAHAAERSEAVTSISSTVHHEARKDSLRCAATPGSAILKEGMIYKTFGRLGTWVERSATLTEGYLQYNSGWYHRNSVNAKRRRINFSDIQWIRPSGKTGEANCFFVRVRDREKVYHFKGDGWYDALRAAWTNFRKVYTLRDDQETDEDDGKVLMSLPSGLEIDSSQTFRGARLSTGVRRAARNSFARKVGSMEMVSMGDRRHPITEPTSPSTIPLV